MYNGKEVTVDTPTKNQKDITINVEGDSRIWGIYYTRKEMETKYPGLYEGMREMIGFQLYGDYLRGSNNELVKASGISKAGFRGSPALNVFCAGLRDFTGVATTGGGFLSQRDSNSFHINSHPISPPPPPRSR